MSFLRTPEVDESRFQIGILKVLKRQGCSNGQIFVNRKTESIGRKWGEIKSIAASTSNRRTSSDALSSFKEQQNLLLQLHLTVDLNVQLVNCIQHIQMILPMQFYLNSFMIHQLGSSKVLEKQGCPRAKVYIYKQES